MKTVVISRRKRVRVAINIPPRKVSLAMHRGKEDLPVPTVDIVAVPGFLPQFGRQLQTSSILSHDSSLSRSQMASTLSFPRTGTVGIGGGGLSRTAKSKFKFTARKCDTLARFNAVPRVAAQLGRNAVFHEGAIMIQYTTWCMSVDSLRELPGPKANDALPSTVSASFPLILYKKCVNRLRQEKALELILPFASDSGQSEPRFESRPEGTRKGETRLSASVIAPGPGRSRNDERMEKARTGSKLGGERSRASVAAQTASAAGEGNQQRVWTAYGELRQRYEDQVRQIVGGNSAVTQRNLRAQTIWNAVGEDETRIAC